MLTCRYVTCLLLVLDVCIVKDICANADAKKILDDSMIKTFTDLYMPQD